MYVHTYTFCNFSDMGPKFYLKMSLQCLIYLYDVSKQCYHLLDGYGAKQDTLKKHHRGLFILRFVTIK